MDNGKESQVEPLFNRCVIMDTRSNTLHGYDRINFPTGSYRRSIAAYAYEIDAGHSRGEAQSTTWYPPDGRPLKRAHGRAWPHLVAWEKEILWQRNFTQRLKRRLADGQLNI